MGSERISYWDSIKDNGKPKIRSLKSILDEIRDGKYKNEVLAAREAYEVDRSKKPNYNRLKSELPIFALGEFRGRNNNDILNHNGFIGLDLDHDPSNWEDSKQEIDKFLEDSKDDPYIYACLKSVSGIGRFILVKVEVDNSKFKPEIIDQHTTAYLSVVSHFNRKYGIDLDDACKNICRVRYLTYDEDFRVNEDSEVFKVEVLKPEAKYINNTTIKGISRKPSVSEMEEYIAEVVSTQPDFINDIGLYKTLGNAFGYSYGEQGRELFRMLCQANTAKYERDRFDREYDSFLRNANGEAKIGSFFHYAIKAGFSFSSHQSIDEVIENKDVLTLNDLKEINRSKKGKLSLDEKYALVSSFLSTSGITRNTRTNSYKFDDCIEPSISTSNTPWEALLHGIKSSVGSSYSDRNLEVQLVNEARQVNPFMDYLKDIENEEPDGELDRLLDQFYYQDGMPDMRKFIVKWLTSLIAAIYGERKLELVLILVGKQRRGKSTFYEELLPSEWREDFLSEGDLVNTAKVIDQISRVLLHYNNELAEMFKSGHTWDGFKSLTSFSQTIERKLFTQNQNHKTQRLAVLGGSTNNEGILSDRTGNSRIIGVYVDKIGHDENSLYEIDHRKLFKELHNLYLADPKWSWRLTSKENDELMSISKEMADEPQEYALLRSVFDTPTAMNIDRQVFMSVESMLDLTRSYRVSQNGTQKVFKGNLTAFLQNELGCKKYRKRIDGGNARRVWLVSCNYIPAIGENSVHYFETDRERRIADYEAVYGKSYQEEFKTMQDNGETPLDEVESFDMV